MSEKPPVECNTDWGIEGIGLPPLQCECHDDGDARHCEKCIGHSWGARESRTPASNGRGTFGPLSGDEIEAELAKLKREPRGDIGKESYRSDARFLATIATLRKALERYGRHDGDCDARFCAVCLCSIDSDGRHTSLIVPGRRHAAKRQNCTCGLSAALDEKGA